LKGPQQKKARAKAKSGLRGPEKKGSKESVKVSPLEGTRFVFLALF